MADESEPGEKASADDPSKKYDQNFFLDLAAKGKDTWNAWRRDPANEMVPVTFAGIDFSEAPEGRDRFLGVRIRPPSGFFAV
jgi:hypothetical protein